MLGFGPQLHARSQVEALEQFEDWQFKSLGFKGVGINAKGEMLDVKMEQVLQYIYLEAVLLIGVCEAVQFILPCPHQG